MIHAATSTNNLDGYASVNSAWGVDPHTMRKPTEKEAIKACRLLLREGFRAFGRPDLAKRKRKFQITSGRRSTWPRSGVWYVNPDEDGLGFAEIIHSVSHYVHRIVNPGLRNQRGGGHNGHAHIEQYLVDYVIKKRWVEDGLKVTPDKASPSRGERRDLRRAKLEQRLKAWRTKEKRATTAIKKINASLKRMEWQPPKAGDPGPALLIKTIGL